MTELLYTGNDWDFDLLNRMLQEVEQIGTQDLGMTLYPNQVEIISADQMLDAYSSHGMPIMYNHWSFGKRLISDSQTYKKGYMGLALEIIINTNPSIAYLMEENSATMQLLVLAHASVGHNFCFANNYMFRQWTDADAIVDYLSFAKNYILKCEAEHGVQAVEKVLDSAHALSSLGVDKYMRTRRLNVKREQARQAHRMQEWERAQTPLWYNLDPMSQQRPQAPSLLAEPEENLLYFLEKHSPILKPWQREILRIVRKISQYWYPQIYTKVVNEGIATFTHHYILNKLFDEGRISHAHMMEFMISHANVIYQPGYDDKRFSGINPYALGFAIFQDLKRMCTQATPEDLTWFPQLKHADWRSIMRQAACDYRDDSFVQQWLSPKVARDLKLFHIQDHADASHVKVKSIHNAETFDQLRYQLALSYDHNVRTPNIMVVKADLEQDRQLHMEHKRYENQSLDGQTELMLQHVHTLWGYGVQLRSVNADGQVMQTFHVKNK